VASTWWGWRIGTSIGIAGTGIMRLGRLGAKEGVLPSPAAGIGPGRRESAELLDVHLAPVTHARHVLVWTASHPNG
jgi:hypothetical protein